jgi:2-polyprenyl-3-methyl-5-hydroxy-6-metoxy-1,4-benzoquinol methylase
VTTLTRAGLAEEILISIAVLIFVSLMNTDGSGPRWASPTTNQMYIIGLDVLSEISLEHVLKASDMKPNFEALKIRWAEMLQRFFLPNGQLKAEFSFHQPCPHCGSTEQEHEFNLNGFTHRRCSGCRSLYVSPRLSDAALHELYSDQYYSEVYTKTMLPIFDKRKSVIGVSKYQQLVAFSKLNSGRVLDIGAGIGEVTDVFKDHGWQTHATEMNKAAVEWLNTRDHANVFHGPLDDYKSNLKFDIVMAWGVVEHVIDPDYFLKRVYDLLKPGGIFVSEVPHGNCLLIDVSDMASFDPKRILMGEQHIMLYSKQAYRDLHTRNGLRELHLQTNGLDCDTIFKEFEISVPDHLLKAMQNSIDAQEYGDLLRGFWIK